MKDLKNLAVDAGIDDISKKIKKVLSLNTSSGITLTSNGTKDTLKVIRYLGNRGILLKKTTEKMTSQKKRISQFLRQLMTAKLPLKENVFTTHTFSTIKINSSSVSNRFSYSKKFLDWGTTVLIISDKEMDDSYE